MDADGRGFSVGDAGDGTDEGVTAEDTEDAEDAERDWGVGGMMHFAVGLDVAAGVGVLE
jgi:hypothetical protein